MKLAIFESQTDNMCLYLAGFYPRDYPDGIVAHMDKKKEVARPQAERIVECVNGCVDIINPSAVPIMRNALIKAKRAFEIFSADGIFSIPLANSEEYKEICEALDAINRR